LFFKCRQYRANLGRMMAVVIVVIDAADAGFLLKAPVNSRVSLDTATTTIQIHPGQMPGENGGHSIQSVVPAGHVQIEFAGGFTLPLDTVTAHITLQHVVVVVVKTVINNTLRKVG